MSVRAIHGDCIDVLPTLGPVDAIVTDPPYHLLSTVKRFGNPNSAPPTSAAHGRVARGFMGQQWDGGDIAFRPETWATIGAALKPGGYLLAFGGTRTWHRLACAIEDAGLVIQDTIAWVYGCLSEDTELVTPNGVTPYHKASIGDLVLCYNPDRKEYGWEQIQEVYEYDIDDTVFRIQSDHTDQIVSRHHRCLVERGGREVFERAETLEREARVPVLENLSGLLDALPGIYARAGHPKPDMLANLQRSADQYGEWREDHQTAHRVRALRERGNRPAPIQEKEASRGLLQSLMSSENACGSFKSVRRQWKGKAAPRYWFGRITKSCMEGWRYFSAATRELCLGSLCQVPAAVHFDGASRRLCDGTSVDCREDDWPPPYEGGSGASRQPRSVGQQTREFDALRDQSRSQAVRGWGGHKTTLARITPERYRGKIWCIRVATGCFVAVRNGKAFATGNSGFPKNKTLLKPAYEPILLAYKPGGKRELQIDECRIESGGTHGSAGSAGQGRGHKLTTGNGIYNGVGGVVMPPHPAGRWPANLVTDGSDEVLALFPQTTSGGGNKHPRKTSAFMSSTDWEKYKGTSVGGDTGSAARFFYEAKAGTDDRWGSRHPTVKPVALMKWLVQLVTPLRGIVLDPFAGSGTTGVAALATGRNAILIERESNWFADIEERVAFYEGEGKHSLQAKARHVTQPRGAVPLFEAPP